MQKIFEVVQNGRVIIFIIGTVFTILSFFGVTTDLDQNTLTDLVLKVLTTLGDAIMAILALWSFLKPKQKEVNS